METDGTPRGPEEPSASLFSTGEDPTQHTGNSILANCEAMDETQPEQYAAPPRNSLAEKASTEGASDVDEPCDDEQELEEFIGEGQTKYELRRKARERNAAFSRTWIDDDKTGLYDPTEEQRKLRQRRKRPAAALLKCGIQPWSLEDSDNENELRSERASKPVATLEVTLKFTSENARAAFVKHVNSLSAQTEPTAELFSERRLRRRDSGVDFSLSLSTRPTKKNRLSDDLSEDLKGHPIARGCWECLTIGIRCPLLEDERAWPCTTCLDDDHACELITPPTCKRPCEHCKGKRIGCSYTYTLDHYGPCEECSRTDWRCVAGPAKEAIRERISYDRDWENDPWQEPKQPKLKKLPSCRRCRERGQPCSFSAGDKNDACTACDMANEICQAELEMKSNRKRKRPQTKAGTATVKSNNDGSNVSWGPDMFGKRALKPKPIIIGASSGTSDGNLDATPELKRTKHQSILISEDECSSSGDESDTPPPPEKNTSKAKQSRKEEGTLETISTKFAHPIKFNYEGHERCHFCSDIRFSMFGLGSTEVEVVVWNDGRGLDEISSGHRGQGIESTRMCVSCTTSRMPIVMCAKHELQPLEGPITDNTLPSNLALTRLLNGTTTGKERWCSICPALAQYECCAAGPYGRGCGLTLCELCMVSMVGSDGSLEQTLEQLKDETSEQRMLGLRADHELLRQEGLLMRFVLWESQND